MQQLNDLAPPSHAMNYCDLPSLSLFHAKLPLIVASIRKILFFHSYFIMLGL